jgi:8-oxo-dGTP diphosphatase
MKTFFACGFLYNPKSKKVLLHKRDSNTSVNPNKWAFFGGTSEGNETPLQCFVRELKEEIGVSVDSNGVRGLYDYFNNEQGTHRHIFYVESELSKENMKLGEGADFNWFTLEDAFVLDLTEKTRKDLEYFQKSFTS